MKIPRNNGLMFYFGGINIIEACMRDQGFEEKGEPIMASLAMKMLNKSRTKVIDKLNKHADLSGVSDLFTKPPQTMPFHPIVANIRIPLSLQRSEYVSDDLVRGNVEKFKIVYDGVFLMIAATCPLNKEPCGVWDARDRFEEILESIYEFKMVPPCLTHQAVIFVNKGEKIPKETGNIFLETQPSSTFRAIAGNLYLKLMRGMGFFYASCDITQDIENLVKDVHREELELITGLQSFLESSWRDVRKRRRLLKESKNKMLRILTRLSNYTSLNNGLAKCRKDLEEVMRHNALVDNLIKAIDLDEYAKPQIILDIESSMRIIGHVRNELEIYRINTSTMTSTLLGAIIGSILTLIVAYSLGSI